MGSLNVVLFGIKFILEDVGISLKLFMKTTESALLESDQVIHVHEMVTKGHLILLFGFVKVTVKHLEDGIFGVDLSVVVLLVDLNLLLEGFSLGQSEGFTPNL